MSCIETPSVERRMEEEGEEMMDDDEEEEEEEVEDEEEEVEEEEEEEEGDQLEVTVGRRSGRGLTLKTLLKERVLEPGEGNMTINYLGNKFKGDLLPDGRIRSQETNKIFGTPSAWAIYCKKIVNPDKKSGCGWASVRYRGKKLDTYKNNWYRQKRLEYEKEEEEMEEEESGCESEEANPHEQEILEFDLLGNRNPNHDPSTMIELGTFQSIGRMQPFNITMSSSAMAVIDVHAHLTTSEVVGYLAGQWDVNNHNLIVSHAFPVRCRLGDAEKGQVVEQELYAEMARLKLSLVGWYHTHPYAPPLPTLRDIDSQLDYEMKMKGYNDASYTPVLGIIVSPYQKSPLHDKGIPHPNGNATGFWVMPPPENKPLEYGRPMSMQFTVVQDAFIPKEALLHMSEVIKYYKDTPDTVELADIFEDKFTYWHKLKNSLKGRVPKDHFLPLIEFLTKVIDKKLPEDDPMSLPPPNLPVSNSSSSSTSSVSAAPNLPPSTSISIVENKETPSSIDNLSSTKDLESCVTNILKSTMGADLISITSCLSDSVSKDKDNSVTITPSSVASLLSEKYNEEQPSSSSRPKSAEGRTPPPPPKSYSPLFQLPLPPLFSLDSGKQSKESQPIKATSSFQPINLQMEEKRHGGEFSAVSKSRSPSGNKVEKSSLEESMTVDSPSGCKYDISELASKVKRRDLPDVATTGGYLDLSMIGRNKEANENKVKKPPTTEEPKKETKESKLGAIDVPTWFAQAKLMQEVFSLPPHERDNPFARAPSPATHRDIPPLFSSDFLSTQWNPAAAAAAALQLSRDAASGTPSLKASYHPSLAFSSDSKPTYHSDVPLLLKKQQEDSLKDAQQRESAHDPKDSSKKGSEDQHREFRLPPEYKDPKETREQREAREQSKKARDIRERPRDIRNPYEEREFKEPKLFREHKEFRGSDHSEVIRDEKEIKIPHSIRDIQETGRRDFWEVKDPVFDDLLEPESQRNAREIKGTNEGRDYREMKDPREISREMIEAKEGRDLREVRNVRDPRDMRDPRDSKDHRETKDLREMRERREMMDSRDIRDHREIRDPVDMRDHRELRDPREMRDHREVRDLREMRDYRAEGTSLHLREDMRDLRKVLESSEGKNAKSTSEQMETVDGPMNLSDFGTPKEGAFRNVNPMDMSTFKIKRDLMNPDGRHFIEPTGIKRHHPDPMPSESRTTVVDFSETRDPNRSPKENIMSLTSGSSNKDSFDSKGMQQELSKDRLEGNFVVAVSSRNPNDLKETKGHESREASESRELVPKALINLRDPKSLLETREYRDLTEMLDESAKTERDERSYPHIQRLLFPPDEELIEGKENPSSATPPVYIPHRPASADEPMDYD